MLSEKAIEVAIGGINGYIKPSEPERQAAYELFVELSSRTTTINDEDDDNRPAREILQELTAMAEITRSILRSNGADSAKGRADGNVTLAVVALRVLNEVIVPRANRWSPLLREHHEARPDDFSGSAADWEKTWRQFDLCRDDLDSMRVEVRSYMDTLAKIAGAAALADVVVPVPPSAPVPARTLPATVEPGPGKPKQRMVPWLDPVEAARSLWAHHVASKQLRDHGRAHVHSASADSGTIKIVHDEREELWVDYVSDLGDAIDPTIAVAWQLTQDEISLPEDRSGELPKPPPALPRGRLLVMGGDQIYPYASKDGYVNQLEMPYRLAAQASAVVRDARIDEPDSADSDDQDVGPAQAAEDTGETVVDLGLTPDGEQRSHLRDIVAIPGNHDWLGGSKHFEKVFVDSEQFADDWNTPQTRRWWAIKLTSRWWIWGLDTALDDSLDQKQIEYFEAASKELRAGDQVIICSPVPLWQLRQKRQDAYFEIRAILRRLIRDSGAHTPLFLAGDSHFFAHYRRVDGAADEHHITAGGGGAFLQPTHNLPEQVPYEQGAPDFKLGARWPRPVDSRGLGTNFGGIKGRQFGLLMLMLAGFHAAVAGLVATRGTFEDGSSWLGRIADAARWVLGSWAVWPLLLVVILAIAKGTVPNSQESNLRTGAWRYGLMHGVAHAALFVAVAVLALSMGADASWWLFAGAPLIGGVLSTLLLVWFVRWINRAIRASDTLAFAPAHVTRYKHFIRMCFQPNGNLKLYVIGIDPVGEGWYRAMTGRSGKPRTSNKKGPGGSAERPGRAIVRQYLQRGNASRLAEWSAERLIPPYDSAGVPKLHYVWGRHFRAASSELLLERERILGVDHPDTIFSRTQRAEALVRYRRTAESVELLEKNVASCERRFGAIHRTTLRNRALLGDGLLAMGDTDRGLEELGIVVDSRQATIDTTSGDETVLTHGELTRHRRAIQAQIHYARASNDHERFASACEVLEAAECERSPDLAPQALFELARANHGLGRDDDASGLLEQLEGLFSRRRRAAAGDAQLRQLIAIFKAERADDGESKVNQLRRLLRDSEQRFGPTDTTSIKARRALGETLLAEHATAREGTDLLAENVKILDELLGLHYETVRARQALAAGLSKRLDRSGALAQHQKVLDFHQAFGRDSGDALRALLETAVVSFKDNPTGAITQIQELAEQCRSMRDVDPVFLLQVRLALAQGLTDLERFDEANVEYEQIADDALRRAFVVGNEDNDDEVRLLSDARTAWAESLQLEGRTDESSSLFMTAFEEGPSDAGNALVLLKLASMNANLLRGGIAEFPNVEEVASYLQQGGRSWQEREQTEVFLDNLSGYEEPDVAIPLLQAWPRDDGWPDIDRFLARAEFNRRRMQTTALWEQCWTDDRVERPVHEHLTDAAQTLRDLLGEASELYGPDSQHLIEMRIELANRYETIRDRLPEEVDGASLAADALEQWESVAAVVGERLPDSALHTQCILHVAVLSLVCEDPDRAIAMCSLVHNRLDAVTHAAANEILSSDHLLGSVTTVENIPDNVVDVKATLARSYLASGRLDEAEDFARQAVELAAAIFPRGAYTRDRAAAVLNEIRGRRESDPRK